MFPELPILCQVGRKTLTQSIICLSVKCQNAVLWKCVTEVFRDEKESGIKIFVHYGRKAM